MRWAVLAALAAIAAALLLGPAAVAAEATNLKLEAIEQEIEADRTKALSLEHRADDLALEIRALRADSMSVARKAQDPRPLDIAGMNPKNKRSA